MVNETCSEKVSRLLEEQILTGHYKTGDRLLYANIAAEYGVSISPVREAFLLLEKEGLVDIIPRRGAFVRALSKQDCLEFSWMRFALESLAADRLCEIGPTPHQIRCLSEVNANFHEAFLNGNANECIAIDNRFHSLIIQYSQMPRLADMMRRLPLRNLSFLTERPVRVLSEGEDIYQTHNKIIDSLVARDSEAVSEYLRTNILYAVEAMFTTG